MNTKLLLGGMAAAGAAAAFGGAAKLFNSVIPRQDGLKVDLSEMADMQQWEEYRKIITPRKEALLARPHESVTLTTHDGLRLKANYFPCDQPTDKMVLALHGYTSKGVSDYAALSHFYLNAGYDMFIPDLRSHGESEGKYYGFGLLDRFDCLEWIRLIGRTFGAEKKIVLHGTSMGAATVLMTGGFQELPDSVRCIVADCAFTSPYDVFTHILKRDYHLPPFPVMDINNLLCKQTAGYGFRDYSTIEALQTNTRPVLLIHGSEDKFVPTRMSFENYNACTAPKELLIVDHAGHAASYYENPALYEEKLSGFLTQYML